MRDYLNPEDFRHYEDEFLGFCHGLGFAAGRKDVAREDDAYRRAITQTKSWKRNEFDTYVVLPPNDLVYVDQKAVLARNGSTGNAAIELRSVWAGLACNPVLGIFVRPLEWDWIPAGGVLAATKGGCCDACFDLAFTGRWLDLEEKCPNKWWRGGSGDPWVKVPLSAFQEWAALAEFVAFRREHGGKA